MHKYLILFILIFIFTINSFANEDFIIWDKPNAENNIIRNNDKKYGLTDKNNIIILNMEYDSIENYSNNFLGTKGEGYKKNVYRIEKNKLYGLADTKGNILYEPQFEYIWYVGYNNQVQSRYLKIKKENKYAIFDIDKKKLITDFIFDDIKVQNEQIKVTVDGKTQYFDKRKAFLGTAASVIFAPLSLPLSAIMALLAIISLL